MNDLDLESIRLIASQVLLSLALVLLVRSQKKTDTTKQKPPQVNL